MPVKASIKQPAATIAAPSKTGNGKSIQPKKKNGLFTTGTFQRKERAGSWLHLKPQKPIQAKPSVQPKIKIHPSDDHFEKEADHIADKVISQDAAVPSHTFSKVNTAAQRKCAHCEKEEKELKACAVQTKCVACEEREALQAKRSYILQNKINSSDSSPPGRASPDIHPLENALSGQSVRGSPLPLSTRRHMEKRIGANFSNVRIHTGQSSHSANAAIGARAFTNGAHIHFSQGEYNPQSKRGQHLLAHELVHTVQQGASPSRNDGTSDTGSAGVVARKAGLETSIHPSPDFISDASVANAGHNKAPPVQRKEEEAPCVQCALIDTAVARISELLTDLPSITDGLEGAKHWLLGKMRRFASFIPGYTALGVVLGQDPITGAHIERSGRNFIEAALDIIPGGSLLKQKLEELGAIDRAANWIDGQLEALSSIIANTKSEFDQAWNDLGIGSIIDGPLNILRTFGGIFERAINNLITFATRAAGQLLDMVKEYLLTQLVTFIKEHTKAYELLKVIIGHDPVTQEAVARNGTNVLNALLELGGDQGREQRRQMQDTGTFQKAADWIDRGILVFGNLYQTVRNNIGLIWDAVSIQSLMEPVATFNRIYETFAEPVRQVLAFVVHALKAILALIKEALMTRLSAWARTVRGYPLITVIIGKDPFTDAVVPRNVQNLIKGFMSLMEGGEEQYRQMEESGAIGRAAAKINAAVERLNMTPAAVVQLFIDLWNSFSFSDLSNPVAAFQRILARFGEPVARLVAFVIEIVKIVIEVILQVMNFPFDLINNIITRAMAAVERIKRDPIGFLKNLLRAIKQGFIQFFNNILTHLRNGLVGWLMSELQDANVPQPTDFSLRGIISWGLQVLNISMEAIWAKLAAHPRIGPERVARLRSMIDRVEGIWTFIRDVQQRGMAAIWDKIAEQLSNLWNTVLDAVKNWIMERIVNQVTARLLSMLDPTGIMAVINSAIAVYRAIQSFIRYLRQMLEVVNSFVNGVADIAEGNVTTAANYLERTMGRAMPIVIGFLANQVGLSGIGRRIGEMIRAARTLVDRALTWLVNRAVDTGFAIFDRLMSMGRSAVGAVLGWLGVRKEFRLPNGEEHHIYFQGNGQSPQLMVASEHPKSIENIVQDRRTSVAPLSGPQNAALTQALSLKASLDQFISNSSNPATAGGATATATLQAQVDTRLTAIIAQLIAGDAMKKGSTLAADQAILEALITNKANPTYPPDSLGRPGTASGHVEGVKRDERREDLPTISARGYLPGDHRGHLIGDRFYGANMAANLVPMHVNLNLSSFKTYENTLASRYFALRDASKPAVLYMSVTANYPGTDPAVMANYRPTSISVASKLIQLDDKATTPTKKEEAIPGGPFSNPMPVLTPINVNAASLVQLRSLLGNELGGLVYQMRIEGRYSSFDKVGERLGSSPIAVSMGQNNFLRLVERLEVQRGMMTFGPLLQPKMKSNPINNHFEREADHIADKVVLNDYSSAPSYSKISAGVQHKLNDAHEKKKDTEPKKNDNAPGINVPNSRGSPLPKDTRKDLEHSMGADFSKIRIHKGKESHKANEAVGSRAFTRGKDIHFAEGEFKPETKSGKHLLAHELVHTVQQGAAPIQKNAEKKMGSSSVVSAKAVTKVAPKANVAETTKVPVVKGSVASLRRDAEGRVVVAAPKNAGRKVAVKSARPLAVKGEKNKKVARPSSKFDNADAVIKEDKVQFKQTIKTRKAPKLSKELLKTKTKQLHKEPLVLPKKEDKKVKKESSKIAPQSIYLKNAIQSAMAMNQLAASGISYQPDEDKKAAALPLRKLEIQQSTSQANALLRKAATAAGLMLRSVMQVRSSLALKAMVEKSRIKNNALSQKELVAVSFKKEREAVRKAASQASGSISGYHSKVSNELKAAATKAKADIIIAKTLNTLAIELAAMGQLPKIDQTYINAKADFIASGVSVGNACYASQNQRSWSFISTMKHEDDSLLDGPYTDDVKQAKGDAAAKVGDGYKDGMIKTGNEQAEKIDGGKSNDYKKVTEAKGEMIKGLSQTYDTALAAIQASEKAGLSQANGTKKSMQSSVYSQHKAAKLQLDTAEKMQTQLTEILAGAQSHQIDLQAAQAADAMEQAGEQNITRFVNNFKEFKQVAAQMNSPPAALLAKVLSPMEQSISIGSDAMNASLQQGLLRVGMGMYNTAQETVAATNGAVATAIADSLLINGKAIDGLRKLQSTAITALQGILNNNKKTIVNTASQCVTDIQNIKAAFDTALTQIGTDLTNGLKSAAAELKKGLQDSVNDGAKGMLATSIENETKAAEQVEPRWKSALKILLVIVVILVVALVVGPAVIGFIGAAAGGGAFGAAVGAVVGGAILGAASSAVITIGNNLIDGKTWHEGLGHAMLEGAVTGAIGGAFGAAGGALGGKIFGVAAKGIVPALGKFAIQQTFDFAGNIVVEYAGSKMNGQPFSWASVAKGQAMGAGMHIGMEGLGALKNVKGFSTVNKVMEGSTHLGEHLGTKARAQFVAPKTEVHVTAAKASVDEPVKAPVLKEEPVVKMTAKDETMVISPKEEPVKVAPKDEAVTPIAKEEPVKIPAKDEAKTVVVKEEPAKIVPKEDPVKVASREESVKTIASEEPVKMTPKEEAIKVVFKEELVKVASKEEPVKAASQEELKSSPTKESEIVNKTNEEIKAKQDEAPAKATEELSPEKAKELENKFQRDEGVEAKVKTDEGHELKIDGEGHIAECSNCKLYEITHKETLDAHPELKEELKGLRKKLDENPTGHQNEMDEFHKKLNEQADLDNFVKAKAEGFDQTKIDEAYQAYKATKKAQGKSARRQDKWQKGKKYPSGKTKGGYENTIKGRVGEHQADFHLNNDGFVKQNHGGELIAVADAPKGKGIDGVWVKDGEVYITETKYNDAQLREGQLSKKWVNDRLSTLDESTQKLVKKAMLDDKLKRMVVRVDATGKVTYEPVK